MPSPARGRAIVTEIPGTTRDLLTETVEIDGIAVTLVDTAGIRGNHPSVETEGIARARRRRVTSRSHRARARSIAPAERRRRGVARDRADAARCHRGEQDGSAPRVGRRARSGLAGGRHDRSGTRELRAAIARCLGSRETARDIPAITNIRHVSCWSGRARALSARRRRRQRRTPEEFVAADVTEARGVLEEVTGDRTRRRHACRDLRPLLHRKMTSSANGSRST